MYGSNLPLPRTGATTDDCGRLWATLTKDYIPRLRMQMRFDFDKEFGSVLLLEVVDDGPAAADGSHWENIWASTTYYNQLHLISSSRLFDLLIVAHKKIDDFFVYGERFAPDRRQV